MTFFEKLEPPRPEMDVKWDSRTHLQNKFFLFLAASSAFGFKISKSANRNKKIGFLKIRCGYQKNAKNSPEEVIGQKLLHTVIKSKNSTLSK